MRRAGTGLIGCTTALLLVTTGCTAPVSPVADSTAAPTGYTFLDRTELAENGREIPYRVFRPAADCTPCDVIVFSHGNLATYDRYDVLLTDWAINGYVVVAPQHVDSEEHPQREAYLTTDSQPLRTEDYLVLSNRFAEDGFEFDGLNFSGRQFAAGHSYGGLIALLAGGAEAADNASNFPENAVDPLAIIAISPPGELDGRIDQNGYSKVDRPTLFVTGTTDILPGFIDAWETHLDAFEVSQEGFGYALIFEGMNHYFNGAFGRITPEGAASETAIDTLNAQILAFLAATASGEAPVGDDWAQTDNPIVRTLTK